MFVWWIKQYTQTIMFIDNLVKSISWHELIEGYTIGSCGPLCSADDFTEGLMQSRAMVSNEGVVFWPPPAKLRSSCKMDITYFPFDDQKCRMKFGSWTYDGFQVDVTNRSAGVDLANYVFSGEWELLSISIVRNEVCWYAMTYASEFASAFFSAI